jgi:uncharacterized membrane protein YjgN (DUF898 family)
MENIVEETIEKSSTNNSFVEVSSIEVPKTKTENSADSYFDGNILELLAFTYFYATITVLTAGLLSAWGKCLLNKYIYNHTVISGKRLKFEGSGEDLFPKMFIWDFFKIITFNIYSIWQPTRYKQWEVAQLHFEDEKLVEGSSYFTGSVWGYFGIRMLCYLITTVSFGLLQPVAYIIRLKWELEHTIINNKVVVFRGSTAAFFGKKLLWTLLSVVTFGIYGFWIHINTLRWQFSNTFLLRKNDSDAKEKNAKINESVSTVSTASAKPKKGISKPVLFVILGVVAIGLIVLLVNIISLFGDINPDVENEIRDVALLANDYIKQNGVAHADDNMNKGLPYKNIKKLHIDSLDSFKKSGGSGWTEEYRVRNEYDYYTGNYYQRVYIKMILRKKSTICSVEISNNYDEPRVECNSFKAFWADRLNINGGNGFSRSEPIYESSYYDY